MRAILRTEIGGLDVLEIREIPEPEPKAGHAAIERGYPILGDRQKAD